MREAKLKRFVAEYVQNGFNASAAARVLGMGSTDGSCRVRGCEALKVAQAHGLVDTAVSKLSDSAILTAQEALEILSEQAVGARPTKTIKKHVKQLKSDGEGWEMVPGKETHYDTRSAAEGLLKFYKPEPVNGSRTLVVNLLEKQDPKMLREAMLGVLTEGGNEQP